MSQPKKSKGPIRFEAILPISIIIGLIWAYFFFFFDSHVRKALEYGGTLAHGAEVNVATVKTSFLDATLEIRGIQVTNAEAPEKNLVELGLIRFEMLWDALLRGKVAVEDASILDIRLGTLRKRPGRVLPPPPPSESKTEQLKAQALATMEKQFQHNVLGDAAALLQGADPASQLKNIEGELKSSKRIKELEAELQKKKAEWEARIARLPKNEDIKGFETRAKSIKTSGFSNPVEVTQSIQQIDALVKDVDGKIKEVQSTSQAVGSEMNSLKKSMDELKSFVDNDIKDLQNRFKIPSLDAASIAKSIFGPMILSRVRQFETYANKAREYMPPKKTPEQKAEFAKPKPRERSEGRTYKFGKPKAYPMFWLKKAAISSKESPDGPSGDITGELKNLTDDPPMLGLPTTLSFSGRFPHSQIEGVKGLVTIDHRTDEPVESLELTVASFPVTEQKLLQSDEVNIGFKEATGSSKLTAVLRNQELNMNLQSVFTKITHETTAKNAMVDDILKNVMNDLSKVTLNAEIKGSWSNLSFGFDSNLGSELQKGFEKQLQAKINEAKGKLQKMIDDAIGTEKNKLLGEFSSSQGDITKVLQSKESAINGLKGELEKQKNKAINEQKGKLQNEAQKAADELKKRLGF